MSGSIASRYIGGVPYGPSMGVSRYAPQAANLPPASPIAQPPPTSVTPPAPDVTLPGGGVAPGTGSISSVGGVGGGGGMNLLSLLPMALGALGYLPEAYNAVERLLGGGEEELPLPPEFLTEEQAIMANGGFGGAVPTFTPSFDFASSTFGPLGSPVRTGFALAEDMASGGMGAIPDWLTQGRVMPEGVTVDPVASAALLEGAPEPMYAFGADPRFAAAGGADGFGALGATEDAFRSVSAPAAEGAPAGEGWFSGIGNWLRGAQQYIAAQNAPMAGAMLSQDLGLTGSLGRNPLTGADLVTDIAGFGGGLAGGLMSSQVPWASQGYGAIGHQAGSTAGGIAGGALLGSALGPLGALFGAFGGALMGGLGGAGAGSQIGPAPTIGRNFSGFGSFDPTGNIVWAGFGGDNGGTGADAQGFGDWFTQALAQEAASRGYAFNPAAAGTSIRVGGYDNFSRRGETPGGYFYDLAAPGATFGGSPENYALRPGGLLSGGGIAGWDGGAFGPQQANAFTTNVLADLVARGVYAPAGQSGPDLGQIAGTFGADYGFYTPGVSFEDALAARNWYIGTHLAQQQENARLAAAQQALIASQPTPGQYDWSGNNPNQMGYWNEGQFFPTENPYATPAGYVPPVDTSGG